MIRPNHVVNTELDKVKQMLCSFLLGCAPPNWVPVLVGRRLSDPHGSSDGLMHYQFSDYGVCGEVHGFPSRKAWNVENLGASMAP